MDGGTFQACASPKQYFLLSDSEGQHTFQVRAKNASGAVDPIPAQYTWTVDSIDPKITFTERPGTATGPRSYDEWITNDRSPSWAWTVWDVNLVPGSSIDCELYDDTNNRYILDYDSVCSSPFTFEGELPDADYMFGLSTEDKAGNYGCRYNYFQVDTVAPKVSAMKPTGSLVGRYANVVVNFDDTVYGSEQFVNIYRKGTTTPLAVYRSYGNDSKKVELSPKSALKPATWYTVKVTTGVTDGANNLEVPKTWSFKTK